MGTSRPPHREEEEGAWPAPSGPRALTTSPSGPGSAFRGGRRREHGGFLLGLLAGTAGTWGEGADGHTQQTERVRPQAGGRRRPEPARDVQGAREGGGQAGWRALGRRLREPTLSDRAPLPADSRPLLPEPVLPVSPPLPQATGPARLQ